MRPGRYFVVVQAIAYSFGSFTLTRQSRLITHVNVTFDGTSNEEIGPGRVTRLAAHVTPAVNGSVTITVRPVASSWLACASAAHTPDHPLAKSCPCGSAAGLTRLPTSRGGTGRRPRYLGLSNFTNRQHETCPRPQLHPALPCPASAPGSAWSWRSRIGSPTGCRSTSAVAWSPACTSARSTSCRQALGLDEPGTPVKVIEPYQMLGEIAPDLADALGVDVVGISRLELRVRLSAAPTGSRGARSTSIPMLVPGLFPDRARAQRRHPHVPVRGPVRAAVRADAGRGLLLRRDRPAGADRRGPPRPGGQHRGVRADQRRGPRAPARAGASGSRRPGARSSATSAA